jgi:hypothetical protein
LKLKKFKQLKIFFLLHTTSAIIKMQIATFLLLKNRGTLLELEFFFLQNYLFYLCIVFLESEK